MLIFMIIKWIGRIHAYIQLTSFIGIISQDDENDEYYSDKQEYERN